MSQRAESTDSLLTNALLIGAGLFLVWKVGGAILSKLGDAAGAVGAQAKKVSDFVTSPIARGIVWWQLPAPIGVTSKFVIQSTGAVLDPTQYKIQWMKAAGAMADNYGGELPTVRVNGVTYIVGPRDSRGNYPLVNVGALLL